MTGCHLCCVMGETMSDIKRRRSLDHGPAVSPRPAQAHGAQDIPPGREEPVPPLVSPSYGADGGAPPLRWEYQWADALNGVGERAVEPALPERLAHEVVAHARAGTPSFLILVRGELGIGKSTLAAILRRILIHKANALEDAQERNVLYNCSVLEAGDLEAPVEYASRINAELNRPSGVIAFARPETLEVTASWVDRDPDATVVMRTFEPDRPLFTECLLRICAMAGVREQHLMRRVDTLARRLPNDLQTPFYFLEIANVVKLTPDSEQPTDQSPLEWFKTSLDLRAGEGAFDDLLQCALGLRQPDAVKPIAGIIDDGGFAHDGYRNVILAVSVLIGLTNFESLTTRENILPAVQIVLDHIRHTWQRRKLDFDDTLIGQLRRFVDELSLDNRGVEIPYLIFFQGLVARSLRQLGDEHTSATLRTRCLEMIRRRARDLASEHDETGRWWDVSDAFSAVGDPRLLEAERRSYDIDSGYFTFVPETNVVVGSSHIPIRDDDAKPVLPFDRTTVQLGPLWVGNFLVTNELYQAFWTSRDRGDYFEGAGRQWYRQEPNLMEQIERSFDTVAPRCYWLDVQERHQVALAAGEISVLEIARLRALRRDRVFLWDPTLADQRFSARGNPVVGINWWEAMAFCRWWTRTVLPKSDFPLGARASLLTDWEWEAIRRLSYDPNLPDAPEYRSPRYPAHLRAHLRHGGRREKRVENVMRPLHVGLSPVPHGPGPFDMVGNVWEFTRSKVFASITEGPPEADGPFHNTEWHDGDSEAERIPRHPARDIVDEFDDLSYRALRGASFFCIDTQAAWNPAYRLCDPPYTSYFDLGFRIAIYEG